MTTFGTPVLAAQDGVVYFVGEDWQAEYSPYPNYYGLFIIIEHWQPSSEKAIYTLYAHLSETLVSKGDNIESGQEIGKVGSSGAATGSHLHFEIRFTANDYNSVSNPELWLQPQRSKRTGDNGAISGQIMLGTQYLDVENIAIKSLTNNFNFYIRTYEDSNIIGSSPWKENFAIGNLPADMYEVSFVKNGLKKQVVEVKPGEITSIVFQLAQSPTP